MLDHDPASAGSEPTELNPESTPETSSPAVPDPPRRLRFGRFEADLEAGLLSREGVPVKLQPQPFKVLALLARRSGQVVSRDEIRREVWGEDTFVNFDQGLAYCLNQIRQALGEQAGAHQYVQTLPRRGYRFIAPVSAVSSVASPLADVGPAAAAAPFPSPADDAPRTSGARRVVMVALSLVAAVLAVVVVIRSLPTPAAGGARTLMVVLPFDELGPETSADHLGDGMTEEIITEIGRVSPQRLGVIARTSAMRYKDSRPELERLGTELGVDHVLEGTVQRVADRMRVTARLVRVSDRAQVWARTYDHRMSDVLALQGQVASDVARSVAGTLATDVAPRPQPVDPEVYRLLVQARFIAHQRTREGYERALALYREAASRDPSSAPAHAGIAQSLLGVAGTGAMPGPEAYAQARAAVRRALELDPTLAEAYAVSGAIEAVDSNDWTAAEAFYRRALELNPSDPVAHHWLSLLLCIRGRSSEAVSEARLAYAADPVSSIVSNNLAIMLIIAGRPAEALAQSDVTIALDPQVQRGYVLRGESLLDLKRPAEAIAPLLRARELRRDLGTRAGLFLARAYAETGRASESRALLDALAKTARDPAADLDHYERATVLEGAGFRDEAFALLEKSFALREGGVRFVLLDPAFNGMHGDPRLDSLTRRLRLTS
jgi:TolB-like protein/DNA-binding winged helix-turn-helix (wHTH) protein/tetratricopeptide (TPR) repeat protein